MTGSPRTPRFRVGSVPYLNAEPLIWGLADDPDVALLRLPPVDLTPRLRAGELDAALLPSIDVLAHRLEYLTDLAIASRGPARSVLLHCRVPIGHIRVVALDRNSRTSNALARVLLERRYGVRPRYEPYDPSIRAAALAAGGDVPEFPYDAAVTIGDVSFRGLGLPTLDLGEAWRDFTDLPFVFALWALARRDETLEARLRQAAHEGRARLDEIAARGHAAVGLSQAECRAYLTENMSYDLGPEGQLSLKLFAKHARALGILS